ncbi:hypothetical protein ATKI12_8428 [Kitasatospora sp. Ki12]|uniref:hypothetical protein n=1 Tax=Kitasatospora xanthocidica TaxID=83382 RepID=UPI001672A1A1|nr:hypothetical protein [Kitasatospora xanthocidica]GHF76131.1 hypothetical protein GCM10018790_62510 [Kitasatospora xanthocidica]
MINPRARLTAMIADLDRNPRVELLEATVAPPTPPADIELATRLAGGRLPDGVEAFYREVGAVRLTWRHTVPEVLNDDLSDQGLIDLLPLREVFGDWEGITWHSADDQQFRAVKPFDRFVPEACAAFVPPLGSVHYHYLGEELYDTGYPFDAYLERLIASRGFWYWPQTLCRGLEDSAEVTAFRRAMPLVFPDYDDTLFHPARR